jgi:hypothetical protein
MVFTFVSFSSSQSGNLSGSKGDLQLPKMLSGALSRISLLLPNIHHQQQHTDFKMAESSSSQALPPSKEAHDSDIISAKSHKQSENFDSDPIHSNARCISEHNQIGLDLSAHNPGVQMRSHMSDAEMEDQQEHGQVSLSLDRTER